MPGNLVCSTLALYSSTFPNIARNAPIGVFKLHKIRRASNFIALKFLNVWSGRSSRSAAVATAVEDDFFPDHVQSSEKNEDTHSSAQLSSAHRAFQCKGF